MPPKTPKKCLLAKHDPLNQYEIGVDECARGPMFGRVYMAAAVLDEHFDHSKMCDSKKIHSQKKFAELAEYIKGYAVAWQIEYIEPWEIDEINIRQAVLKGMRAAIHGVILQLHTKSCATSLATSCFIMVDGNDFSQFSWENPATKQIEIVPYITVKKGDDTYSAIAAASILAKQAHDQYILELCAEYPELSVRYGLDTNMGYGTKKHMDGIREYGLTQWHRKSFRSPCLSETK